MKAAGERRTTGAVETFRKSVNFEKLVYFVGSVFIEYFPDHGMLL